MSLLLGRTRSSSRLALRRFPSSRVFSTHNNDNMPKRKEAYKDRHGFKNQRTASGDEGGESRPPHVGSNAHPAQRAFLGLPPLVTNDDEPRDADRKKQKYAFLLAYIGTSYAGLQMNAQQTTVQGVLEQALSDANLLHPRNFGYPFKYAWSMSGRTDKGVHACAQVVSLKVEVKPDETLANVRETVNALLPADIRVLDVARVMRSFCAHTSRDHVRYQYMIPAFLLTDRKQLEAWFQEAQCVADPKKDAYDQLTEEQVQQLQSKLNGQRVSEGALQRLREALHSYKGTHPFHSFTKGVPFADPRANRYIMSFHVEEPIIFGDTQWIPTQVVGQSFLLHQIRKMVAMAIDVARGAAPVGTIQKAMDESLQLNTAPAQGLFLEMSFYERYNQRQVQNKSENPPLEWDQEGTEVHERWKDFRQNHIMKHIVEEEAKQGNFVKYLFVQEHVYNFRECYKLQDLE